MTRTLITSGSPFETQIGYSRAVAQGDWCFVSGTTGYDPETRAMPDSIAEQAANALKVIGAALEKGGFSFADVVRVTYFLTDPDHFDEIRPAIGAVFGEVRPAMTSLIVSGLIKPEMKLEIEVTAFKGGK
jgi:enamine deaminase RidA (YjgF/YER057c/UK114 family)